MAPILIHGLQAPALPGWCTLFTPLCHQPAPKTGNFDVGYGGTLVSTPFRDDFAYHSEYNGTSSTSALGLPEGTNAGVAADAEKFGVLKTIHSRGEEEAAGIDGELTWVEGTTGPVEGEVTKADGGDTGMVKRGETLQEIAWAAAIAVTKYIIKEGFKAGGRQIYKAFHEGETAGLDGTMFEKAPYHPYSWELQEIEDIKNLQKTWEVIQREGEAAIAREAGRVGEANARRAVEEEKVEDVRVMVERMRRRSPKLSTSATHGMR